MSPCPETQVLEIYQHIAPLLPSIAEVHSTQVKLGLLQRLRGTPCRFLEPFVCIAHSFLELSPATSCYLSLPERLSLSPQLLSKTTMLC